MRTELKRPTTAGRETGSGRSSVNVKHTAVRFEHLETRTSPYLYPYSIFDIRYTNLHCGIFPSRKKDRHDTSLKRRRDPAWEHHQVRYDIPKSLVVYARRETCDSTCVPIVYTLFFIRVILSRFSRITLQLFKGFIGLSFVSLSYPTQLFSLEKNTSPP